MVERSSRRRLASNSATSATDSKNGEGLRLGLSGVTGRPGQLHELGSLGAYGWGGFFYTRFIIDPKEELIAMTLAQLHPAVDVDWNERFSILAYQAIDDSRR